MTYNETQRRFHMAVNGQALRLLMNYNRITVRELAKRSGLSHGLIGDLKSGRRATCTPESARKIEDALGAEPHTIFSVKALPVAATTNAA